MATAEELLAAAGATEEILVVDPDTRVISIPATIKILGVESDDDVKRLYFKVPRYYGEFDLSTFSTRVNFKNARGAGDFYPADDQAVSDDGNYISFSWLVDRTAFDYSGNVNFSICMQLLDEEGVIVKEWNTTYATLPVLAGLETEKALVDRNPTAFNALLCRLYAVEAATGNGRNGYYNVIKVDEVDDGVHFTIVDQDGETVAAVKDGVTFTPSYNYDEGVIHWSNDRGLPNPNPMYIKGDRGDDGAKGDKGDKGDPGKDGKLSSILYVSSPFKVYNEARGTDRETYYANGTSNTAKYTDLLPCPKYLGWKSTGGAAVTIYIGTVDSSGKFVRDTTYDIYIPEDGTKAINYFNSGRNNIIEVADDHVFYYRTSNVTDTDTVTIIGGENLFEGTMDDIAVIPNYVRESGGSWTDTIGNTDCYGIVLPTDTYYMILHKDATTMSKASTHLNDIKVSYEDPDGTLHVSEATPFGYIPANTGVAQLTVPKSCPLEDLLVYVSKPVKSNNTSGRRRLAKEIGKTAITKFTFEGKQAIGWNDNTKRTMKDRRFYGIPYSSRWFNSHFVGFEVSPETALNALNDPYSIAYDGGWLGETKESGEIVNISGKSEIGSRGGPGYGLVCSAFNLLMNGNPYPQTNRGFTFDSNFEVTKVSDINAGMNLINRGMTHVVMVDEIYDNGYSLYEAADPCIAQTIHTTDNPTYAAAQTRKSYLDDYLYKVSNHDISGYDKNLTNFNVAVTNGSARPWRGHKCVYGPWDKSSRGSRIGITCDDSVNSVTLTVPAAGIVDSYTVSIDTTGVNYKDISEHVTVNGTYTLSAGDGTTPTRFRYFNHDDVVVNFDKDGKAYFNHDDVEYVYVTVVGFGGEFSKYTVEDFGKTPENMDLTEPEPMVIANGKCYPDLAKDPSRIADVRAAIVSDKTTNDCWGKYSVPARFGVSEYVDKDEELARAKANAIVCEASGESVVLDDAANAPIRSLKLFGKTTQVATTGAQLLDFSKMTMDSGGTTVANITNSGQTVTITGTKAYAMGYIDVDVTGLTGKTLYLTGSKSGGNTPSLTARLIKTDGSKTYISALSTGYTILEDDVTISLQFIANNTATVLTSATTATFTDVMISAVNGAAWEPYSGGVASPSPEFAQELESVNNLNVLITGANILDVSKLERRTCTSLNVSDDGYTITVVGGTVGGYISARSTFDATLVSALRGKTVVFKMESMTATQDDAKGGPQLTIYERNGAVRYFSLSNTIREVGFTFAEDIYKVEFGVYVNNISSALVTDNTVVVKGVSLSFKSVDWEPYANQYINIPRSIPGIPVNSGGNYTDSDGKQWICDEVDFERGVYVQRVNVADFENAIGERNEYPAGSGHHRFNFTFKNNPQFMPGVNVFAYKCMCNALTGCSNPLGLNDVDNAISPYTSGGLYARCDRFSTTNDFVAWAKEVGLTVVYVLATPIETPLSAAELTAFKALTTNCPNTTILNDVDAWMNVKYNADIKTWVMNYVTQMLNQEA